MAIIGDALRQAFMPKHEYESLRDEDRAWTKLQRPVLLGFVASIWVTIIVCTIIILNIVFPSDNSRRPFCGAGRLQPLPINLRVQDADSLRGAFYLTDAETVDYFWMVLFVPSMIIFTVSAVYLVAGLSIAYTAPARNGCLKVVENNYCASRKGGVRCLSIINLVFAIIFGLLALFLGSSLLTLGSSCSLPLFWCYELSTWGLVILYGGTAGFLRRKAAVILDEGESGARNLGLEMLEANPMEVTPEVERRVNEGFKSWMGSSLVSSDDDDDDDPESYMQVSQQTAEFRQRV